MNNPFSPPHAELTDATPVLKSKVRWKVFFWLIFTLELISVITMFMGPGEALLYMIAEVAVYSLLILGLFGFSYNRRILKPRFWALMIPIGIAFDGYTIASLDWSFQSLDEMYFVIGILLIVFVPLMLFQYLALFLYSFKSEEIWHNP